MSKLFKQNFDEDIEFIEKLHGAVTELLELAHVKRTQREWRRECEKLECEFREKYALYSDSKGGYRCNWEYYDGRFIAMSSSYLYKQEGVVWQNVEGQENLVKVKAYVYDLHEDDIDKDCWSPDTKPVWALHVKKCEETD